MKFLAEHGVKLFRLDAFGYTTKEIGTSCFLVEPDMYDILKWVDGVAREHGAETLPEVHDHASFQYAIALHGMHPYGFALAPLGRQRAQRGRDLPAHLHLLRRAQAQRRIQLRPVRGPEIQENHHQLHGPEVQAPALDELLSRP